MFAVAVPPKEVQVKPRRQMGTTKERREGFRMATPRAAAWRPVT
jgi:hypothetical protein